MKFPALAVLWCLAAAIPSPAAAEAQKEQQLLREDFDSLDGWEPLLFPKISRHSRYSIEDGEEGSVLRAESDASASGIRWNKTFSVYEYPRIRWRWKVMGTYSEGDAAAKSGDDYPLRLYIVFHYTPENAGFSEKIKYKAAKIIYGEYPPLAALNYIWANRRHDRDLIPSAYSSRSIMIPLRGPGEAGSWYVEEAHLLEDYRRAYGKDPPAKAGIAVMNDSDNTGEKSLSYIDFIEIYR